MPEPIGGDGCPRKILHPAEAGLQDDVFCRVVSRRPILSGRKAMEDLARVGGAGFTISARPRLDRSVSSRRFSFVNLSVYCGRWICLLKVGWQTAVDDFPNSRHQAIAVAEIFGLNRLVKDYGHDPRLDPKSSLRHDVVRSDNGYRHDWHSALFG